MTTLHPEDIKASIRKRYGSLAHFERALSLPPRTAADVLRGRSVGNTARAIAKEIGVDVKIITQSTKVKKSAIADKSNAPKARCHRLNVGAN